METPRSSKEMCQTPVDPPGEPGPGVIGGKEAAPRAAPSGVPPAHLVIAALGIIAFLYFGRPVILPVFLAWLAATTLRPLVSWLSRYLFPTAFSAAVVFSLLVGAIAVGFIEMERPATRWMNEAPARMTELRQRVQRIFTNAQHLSQATAAVSNLGATEAEKREDQRTTPMVQVKDEHGTTSLLNWTGTFLAGLGEVLVLTYLLLASGDLFLQKLVRVTPTLRGKIRAVEITREIQDSISNYLFSVTLINVSFGAAVGAGLFAVGVPNATMWGLLAALLNFVPYFGPIAGVVIISAVGLLSFDSPWRGLLPPLWYLALHLLEANFVTPILLGRRLTLNPVAVFVSLIFWTWLWGVSGALLSVPILVTIKVICDRLPAMSHFGEFIGR
jgi:predicted PurR-regulated permease PerM